MVAKKFDENFAGKSAGKIAKIVEDFGLVSSGEKPKELEGVIRSGMMSYFNKQEPGSDSVYASGIAGYLVHEVLVDYLYKKKSIKLLRIWHTSSNKSGSDAEIDLTKEDFVFSKKLGIRLEGAIYNILIGEMSKYK